MPNDAKGNGFVANLDTRGYDYHVSNVKHCPISASGCFYSEENNL